MAGVLDKREDLIEVFRVHGAVLVHITEALADVRNTISVDVINISVFDVAEVENAVAVAVLASDLADVGDKIFVAVGEDVTLAVVKNPVVVAVARGIRCDFGGVRNAILIAVVEIGLVHENLIPRLKPARNVKDEIATVGLYRT